MGPRVRGDDQLLNFARVSRLHSCEPRHGTLYIGVTNSLQKRLDRASKRRGSSFVKAYGVHRLVYAESGMIARTKRSPGKNS